MRDFHLWDKRKTRTKGIFARAHVWFNDRTPLRVPRKMHHPRMVCTGTRRAGNIFQMHSVGAVITLSAYPPRIYTRVRLTNGTPAAAVAGVTLARTACTRALINSVCNDVLANLNLVAWRKTICSLRVVRHRGFKWYRGRYFPTLRVAISVSVRMQNALRLAMSFYDDETLVRLKYHSHEWIKFIERWYCH